MSHLRIGALLLLLSDVARGQIAPTPISDQVETAPSTGLAVHLTLKNTPLSEEQIRLALESEFKATILIRETTDGLQITVNGKQLQVSYYDGANEVIERTLSLPVTEEAQLDTIALLAGNLARDEAGMLLAQLRVNQKPETSSPTDVQPTNTPAQPPKKGASKEVKPTKKPEEFQKTETPETLPSDVQSPKLEFVPASASFTSSLSYPFKLNEKLSVFHGGLFYSDIGNAKGFAFNAIALRNRGLGSKTQGRGVQLAGIWLGGQGFFTGVSAAGIVTTQSGGAKGMQGAGIITTQSDGHEGVQGAGLVAHVGGSLRGVQGAGLYSATMQDVEGLQLSGLIAHAGGPLQGVQGAGLYSATMQDVEGLQLSGLIALTHGHLKGMQASLLNWAHSMEGTQLALFNGTPQSLNGLQVGVVNYSGDFQGAQVGIVNIGGRGKGAMVGLLNVAQELEGPAIAPVNIIPGARNQFVSYVSYSSAPKLEGMPNGPLTHVGFKVMTDPIYIQASFGLGGEASVCVNATEGEGERSCSGGHVEYASGLAIGARSKLVDSFFLEVDGQYQFERAFSSSKSERHSLLARAAFGYELGEYFAIIAGGGPRLDFRNQETEPQTHVTLRPHVFAGVQVF